MSRCDPVGIIAGGGLFPVLAAKKAKDQGVHVVSVGFKGITSPEIETLADRHLWIGMELAKMIQFFHKENVQKALLAGTVDHAHVLGAREKLKSLFDPRTLRILGTLRDRKAQTILTALVNEFEKEGIKVLPSYSFLETELLQEGPLGQIKPAKSDLENIKAGFKAAKELARLDIGLTCCIQNSVIIAVEALEGTDECILRAGEIVKKRFGSKKTGFAVVKVARPDQDPRFDLPVLGQKTLDTAHWAGASLVAAEAGWTLVLEKEKVIKAADGCGLAVYGIGKML
ncbi:MAG: UDP-2,3-diacylglucosamine diphosphatase LpxI [Elusimicrobia bacterium]|nr:UDP-2,3-diacylglucosamine diphosphatase LpxI [Elusimicrobiota bacterium]